MISKLHTKPIFNTLHKVIKHSKNITRQSLLTVLFTLFTCIVSTTTSQAELIDLSDSEPVIQASTRDAGWLRPPKFDRVHQHINQYLTPRSYDQDGNAIGPYKKIFKMVFLLEVDKEGNIGDIKVIESSGMENIDSIFSTELKKARFKPFAAKGKAVNGKVTIPIVFEY